MVLEDVQVIVQVAKIWVHLKILHSNISYFMSFLLSSLVFEVEITDLKRLYFG